MNSIKIGALVVSVAVILVFVYNKQNSQLSNAELEPPAEEAPQTQTPQNKQVLPPNVKVEPIIPGNPSAPAATPAFQSAPTPIPVVGKNLTLQTRVRMAATNEFFRGTGVMFNDMTSYDSELDLANPDFAVLNGINEKNGGLLFIGTAPINSEQAFISLIQDKFENAPPQWKKETLSRPIAGCRNCSGYSFNTVNEKYFVVIGENAAASGNFHLVALGLKSDWTPQEKEIFLSQIQMFRPTQ